MLSNAVDGEAEDGRLPSKAPADEDMVGAAADALLNADAPLSRCPDAGADARAVMWLGEPEA